MPGSLIELEAMQQQSSGDDDDDDNDDDGMVAEKRGMGRVENEKEREGEDKRGLEE